MTVTARAYLIKPGANPWASGATPNASSVPNLSVAVREGQPGRPPWADLVAAAATSEPNLDSMSGPGAALLVEGRAAEHGVMFCFGSGRHLLRSGSWVAGFGMRATLNAAAMSGTKSTSSLLAVSYSTVEQAPVAGTLRGSVGRGLTQYAVDSAIDRIRGVRAANLDKSVGVGRSLEGATSLAIEVEDVAHLVSVAGMLRALGTSTDYMAQWEHLDGFLIVEDPEQRDLLNGLLEERLKSGQLDGISLDPPPDVDDFGQVWFGGSSEPSDFTIAAALGRWRSNLGQLLGKQVKFGDDTSEQRYHLRDLLTAQVDVDGETFLLDQGEWQQLSSNRLAAVKKAVDAIQPWEVGLTPWASSVHENDYLAGYSDDLTMLVLDRKNISANGATVMEFCDLLHSSGAFVHVKRRDTKGLSHLAAQATGSATRWSTEPAFQAAVARKVAEVSDRDPAWEELIGGGARQSDHPVVIAIGTDRTGPISAVTSTLAQLHLHRAIHAIESRGFPVRYTLIPET